MSTSLGELQTTIPTASVRTKGTLIQEEKKYIFSHPAQNFDVSSAG
jgi:hypothetical protein